MTDIRRDIERILNSSSLDVSELSRIADVLRDERLFDLADDFTVRLLQKHTGDTALLMRAWFLADMAGRYKEASDVLRTIGTSDDVMFALLSASVELNLRNDADEADNILEKFAESHVGTSSAMALEAARMFVTRQFTDLAEKWILQYHGVESTDYLLVYADILVAEEEFNKAADVYRKITRADAGCCEAWIRLSDVLINLKDYAAASEAAVKALQSDSTCVKARENIRICRLCVNRHNNKTYNN